MTELITELESEHKALMDTLQEVRKLGAGTKEGRARFLSAKNAFLAHLKKEDERLYPVMKRAARTDEKLQRLLDGFARDMDEISKRTMEFFNKYKVENAQGMEFARELGSLFATLGNRMSKEEMKLYKEYDKLLN